MALPARFELALSGLEDRRPSIWTSGANWTIARESNPLRRCFAGSRLVQPARYRWHPMMVSNHRFRVQSAASYR